MVTIENIPMAFFKSNKEKRKEIGAKVGSTVRSQEEIGGVARGYEKLRSERQKLKQLDAQLRRGNYENSFGGQANTFFQNLGNSVVRQRKSHLIYGRDVKRPIIGSGRGKKARGGRGRPAGPSGKYVIPGVGPVGVYEYRIWLRAQLRQKRMEIQQQGQLTPEQRYALLQLRQRQQAQANNPENQVVPDTSGYTPLKSIHQEADDAANIVD